MTQARIIFGFLLCSLVFSLTARAQELSGWEIEALSDEGGVVYDFQTGTATATNGVLVKYGLAVLTADSVTVRQETGEVSADGKVRIQRDNQVWASEHVRYNFFSRQLEAQQFRAGMSPFFVAGEGLHGGITNQFYVATNAVVTSDDIENPTYKLRARRIRILPGNIVQARDAVLYVGGVPVFYLPYYSRKVGPRMNHFNFLPGYRTSFGAFLLSSYQWYLSDELDTELHLDYRYRRGVGLGPDVNYNYGRWGEGAFKYYYLHDQEPDYDAPGADIPADRKRVSFTYLAQPLTNLSVRSMVRYQGDTNIVREFFEHEYRENPQPSTFVEANKFWNNFSLDAYVQPRVNDFLETVERLPDVRLTGYRQQIGGSPLYYESESSVGYYRRLFAETNSMPTGIDYSAGRADTYHQVTLPYTFFGWLDIAPRVGGRFTYYTDASGPGSTWEEESRGVFNTGAEVSFKASRVWPTVENRLFQVDGLRHIIKPSFNYVYVPNPSVAPDQLPQFDYELPSLRLLPIDFPDYNAIDSIDSQNVLRLGLRNKLQTKRDGKVANLLNWDLYTDWRLDPRSEQPRFADVFSDVVLWPWSWLRLESLTRYDPEDTRLRMAFESVTLQPNDVWSWSFAYFYLRDYYSSDPTAWGEGSDLFSSTIFYRFDDNWGFRLTHRYDIRESRLTEQAYSIYRDLRSWTAALTLRLREDRDREDDVTVAFVFSIKAFPRYGVGSDAARPRALWGG
jgi:lipopolysaccharide assembly outer membrane protein LptD (OstA)